MSTTWNVSNRQNSVRYRGVATTSAKLSTVYSMRLVLRCIDLKSFAGVIAHAMDGVFRFTGSIWVSRAPTPLRMKMSRFSKLERKFPDYYMQDGTIVRSALESLTVHGAETAEEQEDKERLLFEFWAISRALEHAL